MKKIVALLALCLATMMAVPATADDLLNPNTVYDQSFSTFETSAPAVDGINFDLSAIGGAYQRNVLGTASNFMLLASLSAPLGDLQSFGFQVDLGAGVYDGGDFTSAAAALHIFHRDPNVGMIGIYGDWGYVDPEHAGRVGAELAVYYERWSLDALVGIQFGQHVESEFIDEVDISYYFTDNFKGSIGHRLTSRGSVANVGFEYLVQDAAVSGISIFGQFEAGEDNYTAGWGGVRYAFGTGASNESTLIERDRQAGVQVRIPRNIASVTQCGDLDVPKPATSLRAEMSNLCASESEINAVSSTGITKK